MGRKNSISRVLIIGLILGGTWGIIAGAADRPANGGINQRIGNFTLAALDGKEWTLHGPKDTKATVAIFVSTECPMSNAYTQTLAELAKTFGPKGVRFVAINANPEEDAKQITAHAKDFQIGMPLLLDTRHVAVEALKPAVNPEAFVLDANNVLQYRGRIDDAYAARLKKNAKVTRNDLQLAIESVLEGKPVSIPVTKAFGCPIPELKKTDTLATAPVTFHRDVLPILQNNCQTCHRPGEVGPFSLMTFTQAKKWGDDCKDYTQNRKMPPWKPVDAHGIYQNERAMTDKEIATIAKWVDNGMPEGDPKDAPMPRQFADGWMLGEPDLVLSVPEEMEIGAAGRDLFRVFVLPTGLTEDKYVTAYEVRPGNKRVVHHSLNFIDILGQGRKLEEKERQREKKSDEQDKGPGYTVSMGVGFLPRGSVGGWAPGQVPRHLPEGVGYLLPKNSDVVIQMHYHRTGKVERDRTRVGFYFAKKPVKERFQAMILPGVLTLIPAGNDNYKVQGHIYVYDDVNLYTVMPHMHLLGRNIKATMTLPDGTIKNLVNINDWDYNWQETYFLNEPIPIPAGTRFDVVAHYDNSIKNPLNPNSPPKLVHLGEQTTDEMCFVFLGATSSKPGRIPFGIQPKKADENKKPDSPKQNDKKIGDK